jgi:hypothetical protein
VTKSPRLPDRLVRPTAGDRSEATEAGPPGGWAQMTRRLLWSTPWDPSRTIAFAVLGTERAVGLVGAGNLSGLTGATAQGGTWAVRSGRVVEDQGERVPLA